MKKQIASGIMAFVLAASANGYLFSAGYADSIFAEDTEVTETAAVTDEQILGTWEGYYTGYSESERIKRTISLNIYECTDGAFKGVADVTSSEGLKYYFTGNYNAETGKMSFEGKKWIVNYLNYAFSEFIGSLDPSGFVFTGLADGEEDREFEIKKISAAHTNIAVDLKNVCREWVGEYDGMSDGVLVRRNYRLSITDIDEDGKIKGSAVLSPSEKAEAKYAETGSYYFEGTIDESTGIIHLQGNEWIEHPKSEDFIFVILDGRVDANIIDGYVDNSDDDDLDNGIWKMESARVTEGDLDFDNGVTVNDLIIMKRYILMDLDFSQAMINLSDMTGDGVVNSSDFNRLHYMILNGK